MVSLARVLRTLPAIAAAAAVAVTMAQAQAQKVGVNSAVNPDATGTPPGGAQRKLVLGQEVVHNEHVTTGPQGTTQILFLDESAMTVGPNADVTIDEFVYDPNTGNGRLAMSATQGVMRFVGGRLSKKTDAVSLTTPVGTLGIRGGVFLAELSHDGSQQSQGPLSQQLAQLSPGSPRGSQGPLSLRVVFLYGSSLSVTGGNVTQTITRPGFSVLISGAGATPTPPGPPPAGTMPKLMGQFLGRNDTHGGSKNPPSETSVANSGVATDISGNVAASDQQAAQNSAAGSTAPLPNINAVVPTNINSAVFGNIASTLTPSPPPPSPPPPPQPFPDTTGISGGLNVLGTNPAFGFSAQIAPYSGGVVLGGVLTATISNGNFNLGLHNGNTATVTLPLLQGGPNTVTAVGNTPLGPVSGTTFVTSDNGFFFADLFPVASPANTIFFFGGTPVNPAVFQPTGASKVTAFTLQPDAVLQSPIPFIRNQTGGSLSNPTVSPLFLSQTPNVGFNTPFATPVGGVPKALQASLAIAGQGPGQSSVLTVAVGNVFATTGNSGQTIAQPVLNGTVEGAFLSGSGTTPTLINSALLTAIDSTGNSFYGKTQISGFVVDPNSCCQANGNLIAASATEQNPLNGAQTAYQFNQPATTTTLPAIGSGTQTSNNLTGFAGGIMNKIVSGVATPYAVTGSSAIQTNAAISQIAAQITVSDPLTLPVSGVSNLQVSYGSLTPGNTASRQAFINDNLFATLESPGGTGSSLNGSTSTAQVYLVNGNAVPNTTLLPTGTLCQQCQFLQWGYWGGQVTTPSPTARTDVGAINFWVSGFQTPVAQLPTVGSGSYAGSAIGSVVNGTSTYIAAGGFNQTYNFGSQTGTVNITNFDGANYSSTVSGVHGTSNFSGPLAGPAGRNGSVNGGFFGTGANAAAETGGSFAIQSAAPGYLAGGVFAGRLTGPIH